jgi:nitrogen fixation/metabolism regulation signal transduction histidine kinase
MPKATQTPTSTDSASIPFPRVTGLVRQLTHDVRNGLNNVDLQAAFLQEIVTDPQAVPEIKRLRSMVSDAAKMLQAFSAMFWLPEPNFVTYSAEVFIEDFKTRLSKILPEQASEIQWTVKLGKESISVDIEMLFRGLAEFFKNAFHFRQEQRPVEVHVSAEKGNLVIELIESKSSVPSEPEAWGSEPLISTRRSGFGMGLFYARQVLAAHGGEIEATFDPAAERLTTRVSLPLATC